MRPFVELTGVSHTYATGGTLAVDGLDIRVNEGEFAAVVGPSGCGKSTLMKLATGLQFPQAGAVVVDGKEVRDPVKIAGMAFQAPTLLPWRTTLENLMLPLEIVEPHRSRLRRHKAEYVAKAEALLESVGLKGAGSKFPWQLSGGMQQRASLCRALIHEPKLLMLDEPFGALDAFTREELWCVIRDLHARMAGSLTVILVTHDLREATYPRRPHLLHVVAAGKDHRREGGRLPAAPRSRDHLHAGILRHRPRPARAHRPCPVVGLRTPPWKPSPSSC